VVAVAVVPLLLVADRQDELASWVQCVHLLVDERPGIVLEGVVLVGKLGRDPVELVCQILVKNLIGTGYPVT
jgi:fumarylacetoacetate (FAA) hydrolase family protein